jgi:superfamily II DNA or RNA helicase
VSITLACQDAFADRTRARGQHYFHGGNVRYFAQKGQKARAEVLGSQGGYLVSVDWSDIQDGGVTATCTCPHYEDGFLCKHIWAVLLTLEERGTRLPGPIAWTGIQHAYDLEDDEDEGRAVVSKGREVAGAPDDHWEALGQALPPDIRRALREALARDQQNGKAGHRSRRPATDWQYFLHEVAEQAAARLEDPMAGLQASDKQRQAWFVLDVTETVRAGKLTVGFLQRERRRDGTYGKMRPLRVRSDQLEEFDDQDRELLEMLIGNQPSQEAEYGYYFTDYRAFSQVTVGRSIRPVLLPRLAETGRFVWQLDTSLPVEEAAPVVWDDGPPWRFCLVIEEDQGRQRWQISGQLRREGTIVTLDEPVFLMVDGLVLFRDALARLEIPPSDFGWIVGLRRQGSVEVPYQDRGRLLELLHGLPRWPDIDLPSGLRPETVVGVPQGHLQVKSPSAHAFNADHQLRADVCFDYGGERFDLDDEACGRFDPAANRSLLRDRRRETELLEQLAELGLRPPSQPPYFNETYDFSFPRLRLPEIVARLTRQDWIVESDGQRIRRPGAMQLSVKSNVDWFELDGRVDFDGVTASLPRLLAALRDQQRYVRLDDGSQGMLPEEWLQKFASLAEMAEQEGDALRFAPSQALLLDAMLAEQEHVEVDRDFTDFRNRLRDFSGVKPAAEPRGFGGVLRPYQKEGLGWLHFLRQFHVGGCLADDMGLGKTVQVLALLQSRRLGRPADGEERRPSMVVVPKSLVFNWLDEAARFTPRLRTFNYTGTDRKARLQACDGFDLLVTTYGTLRRDIADLRQMAFDYAILDESQAIKNHNSQAAKAARLLTAQHRLAMTGTPVENHLGELWSLFEFLNPGMLGRSTTFQSLTRNGQDDEQVRSLLGKALRPFLLRRTKDQVLSDLPEKTEQTLYCEMSAAERKHYDELRDYYRGMLSEKVGRVGLKRAKIHVLEALLRLRQAACHPGLLDKQKQSQRSPKLEALLEQVREVVAEGHKALVFSQFTSLLAIVRDHLDKEGIAYEYLDGRTRKRAEKVKRFQSDPDLPLFLISLKAGGHGLNLTAADYVFILDPWWNPAVEAQAIDRAHRIGQTRRVFAYRIICRNTVEDKILELQATKRELANAIVSADNSMLRSLTAEDLQLLLS